MEENKYKYWAIGFALIALIFVILFFTKDDKASQALQDAQNSITDCQQDIASWLREHGNTATSSLSSEDQNRLNQIINDCNKAIQNAQENI